MAKACEDCGDDEEHIRRRRCPRCGLLICGWCLWHTHKLAISANAPCPTQRPAMASAPVNRYGEDR